MNPRQTGQDKKEPLRKSRIQIKQTGEMIKGRMDYSWEDQSYGKYIQKLSFGRATFSYSAVNFPWSLGCIRKLASTLPAQGTNSNLGHVEPRRFISCVQRNSDYVKCRIQTTDLPICSRMWLLLNQHALLVFIMPPPLRRRGGILFC